MKKTKPPMGKGCEMCKGKGTIKLHLTCLCLDDGHEHKPVVPCHSCSAALNEIQDIET